RVKLLTNIADARAELFRSFGVLRIVREQMTVRDQHRAASACVRDDRSPANAIRTRREGIEVSTSELARAVEVACMGMQGAATHLRLRRLSCATIHPQNALRGVVNSLE